MKRWAVMMAGIVVAMGMANLTWAAFTPTASINDLTDNLGDVAYVFEPSTGTRVGWRKQPTDLNVSSWAYGSDIVTGTFDCVALADIDASGHLDAAWGGASNGNWRYGNGNGTWGTAASFITAPIRGMDLLDMDGDGDIDALVADATTNQNKIRWRAGSGTVGSYSLGGAVKDVTGNTNTGTINSINPEDVQGYALGTISGTYKVMTLWSADPTTTSGGQVGGIYWRIVENGNASSAAGTVALSTERIKEVALGDIDNDGVLEAVWAHGSGISTRDLTATGPTGAISDLVTNLTNADALALGYVDGDSWLDLVYSYGTGTYYRLNNGDGTFGTEKYIGGDAISLDMVQVIPEPATLTFLALGVFGFLRRKG